MTLSQEVIDRIQAAASVMNHGRIILTLVSSSNYVQITTEMTERVPMEGGTPPVVNSTNRVSRQG